MTGVVDIHCTVMLLFMTVTASKPHLYHEIDHQQHGRKAKQQGEEERITPPVKFNYVFTKIVMAIVYHLDVNERKNFETWAVLSRQMLSLAM